MQQAIARQEATVIAPLAMKLREKIDTIRQTVAKGASDSQLEMFLTLAERYQLDPFLKEIWYTPQVGIITGRDGYLKVAQRDPDFDGLVSCAVRKGDHFEMDPVAPTVHHRFGAERGPVIGAYAVVYHKQRRPAVCFADLSEYRKAGNVWSTYTSAMICKVAEVMALKRQFGISGLVSEEEIGVGVPVAENATHEPVPVVIDQPRDRAQELRDRMRTKDDIVTAIADLRQRYENVLGEEQGRAAFESVVKIHGVMDGYKNLGTARAFAVDLQERLAQYTEQAFNAPTESENRSDWLPEGFGEQQEEPADVAV